MRKRYATLAAVLVIAAAAAVAGLLLAPEKPAVPNRILLPNTAGRVVFNHLQHNEQYEIDCSICHHENSVSRADPQPCGACHGVEFDAAFTATHQDKFKDDPEACLTCHHLEFTASEWNRDLHDLHAESLAETCQSCHHNESIEPEPMACSNCHEQIERGRPLPEATNSIIYRDAVHARCASCHAHAHSFDAGLKGCSDCHDEFKTREGFVASGQGALSQQDIASFSRCASCHYDPPANEVMPARMQAFHSQCGDCHAAETEKTPPLVKVEQSEKQQCSQCHIR